MKIKVPHLGESVTEAVVCDLLKEDGAFVKTDDEVLEIETEKVNQVIYAPCSGTLKLHVKIGDELEPGDLIGEVLEGQGESLQGESLQKEAEEQIVAQIHDEEIFEAPDQESFQAETMSVFSQKTLLEEKKPEENEEEFDDEFLDDEIDDEVEDEISEEASKDSSEEFLESSQEESNEEESSHAQDHQKSDSQIPAEEYSKDLQQSRKNLSKQEFFSAPKKEKPSGRQSKEDYLVQISQSVNASDGEKLLILPKPDPLAIQARKDYSFERKPLTKLRKVIQRRLLEAKNNSASLTTFNELDLSYVKDLRKRYGAAFLEKHGIKLGFMSFFVKASVYAMQEFPQVLSFIEQDEWVQRLDYDVAIAISTQRGLVVPVIRNCERLSFAKIETALAHFQKKAVDGRLNLEELEGGGFTITNGGVFGSLFSTPLLNPPQSAILGMHKIQDRVVVSEGQMCIRPMMYLALTYNHAVMDGKEAVGFLMKVKEYIENPLEDAEKQLLDL